MKNSKDRCKIDRYTVEHYNNRWSKYDLQKLITRLENFKQLLNEILRIIYITESMTILDIGTGPGTVPIAIMEEFGKNYNIKIWGIDPSSVSISIATNLTNELGFQDQVSYKVGSFEKIPFSNEYFDAIISNASFNLCTDKLKAISEMTRVVKKTGQIIIGDCFRKDEKCQTYDDEELWAQCISGAITTNWLISNFKKEKFIITHSEDLTEIVTSLVLNNKWKWPEFIDNKMEYHVLSFKLSETNLD